MKGNERENLRDDHFWDIRILRGPYEFHIMNRMLSSGIPLHPGSKTAPVSVVDIGVKIEPSVSVVEVEVEASTPVEMKTSIQVEEVEMEVRSLVTACWFFQSVPESG